MTRAHHCRTLCSVLFGLALAAAPLRAEEPPSAGQPTTQSTAPETGWHIPVAPVDPESQAGRILHAVVSSVEDWLTGQASRLEVDRPVDAIERDGSVRIEFSNARVSFEDGSTAILGDVALDVTPRADDVFDFATSLPAEIEGQEPDGTTVAEIRIGDNHFAGTWRADLETATSLNGLLERLVVFLVEGEARRVVGEVGQLSVQQSYAEREDGLWDGALTLAASDIFVGPQETEGTLRIASLSLAGELEGFDLTALREAMTDFDLSAIVGAEEPEPEEAMRLLDSFDIGDWGRSSSRFHLAGLEFVEVDGSVVSLGSIDWRFFVDTSADPGSFGIAFSLHDLVGVDAHVPPEVVPQHVELNLALERFPFQVFIDGMREVVGSDGEAFDEGMPDEEFLLDAMSQAGTVVEIETIAVRSQAAAFEVSGTLRVDGTSALGVVGQLQATVVGLDRLVEIVGTMPEGADTLPLLLMLQGLGAPRIDEEATELIYEYLLVVPADGAVTMNGISLDFLGQEQARLSPGTVRHAAVRF